MDEKVLITKLPSRWRGVAADSRSLVPGNHHPHADTYESCANALIRATQMRVTAPHDSSEVVMSVPHTPEAEAALLQECRERISHLKMHVALPGQVMALEEIDKGLEELVANVAGTESYDCPEFEVLDCR